MLLVATMWNREKYLATADTWMTFYAIMNGTKWTCIRSHKSKASSLSHHSEGAQQLD